jgi:predicted unusual protein kinase regulating ubiquinone biosynthesis (AarF/ABC1/UbiB family)
MSVSPKKEPLKAIRANLLSRGLSLARASLKAGGLNAKGWADIGRAQALIQELGKLKGTAMKVGQMLSMYGEHLLPKEINELLKSLQQDTPPLAWAALKPVLETELGEERLTLLEIEETPVAAASIGQVHRARVRESGRDLALKIQYPGIDRAVDTDLKLLKFILNISEMIPRGPRFDQIFAEIRAMFLQEIDYGQELESGRRFHDLLRGDSRFVVPRPEPGFSARRVLATEYADGVRADSPEAQALSQERRNRLGRAFLALYMRELFDFRLMQTDPHRGNYKIRIDADGENDRLVLLDFGAVREVPEDFLTSYSLLVEGGLRGDPRRIEKGGRQLGLLLPDDPLDLVEDYISLCLLLVEPFNSKGDYDWGSSDLPRRVAKAVSRIATTYRLRTPPRELVFLDRKLGGVFIFLSVLKCKMAARDIVEEALATYLKGSKS